MPSWSGLVDEGEGQSVCFQVSLERSTPREQINEARREDELRRRGEMDVELMDLGKEENGEKRGNF